MSFDTVKHFEAQLAEWWCAPYAVATDCCTHAIELCLRYTDANNITVPKHTYISVPFLAEKLNLQWSWSNEQWENYYTLGNTNIIDSAVHWKQGGYLLGSLQCLSFQFKKPLNLGRGGAILCGTRQQYDALKAMAYDGRDQNTDVYWGDQEIKTIGYHYYMTPETAQMGIEKLPTAHLRHTRSWSWRDYPDTSLQPVFRHVWDYLV